LLVHQPRTWLLRAGWAKSGAPISVHEVPSSTR